MEKEPESQEEAQKSATNEKGSKKGEHREKRPRAERKNIYEYNAEAIDENTIIPALPKKNDIIPKPDIKKFKEKEKNNSLRIEDIINKKKQIRAEKFVFKRKAQGGDTKHSELQSQFGEVQQLRDKLSELNVERKKLGDELHQNIERAKANNEKIKEYRTALKGSRQNFSERLKELEHTQMTKDLNKVQEKEVNNQIMLLKRKIKEAESSGDIEIKLEHAEDLKEELGQLIDNIKKQKDPIDKEVKAIKDELDIKKKQIEGIKDVLNAQKNEKNEEREKHNKDYEDWKEGKKKRLDKLEKQIVKIKEDSEKLWDQFHQNQEDYWKQKQLIEFIQWQNRVKNRKIAQKEREVKRLEYEERDKQRQKDEKLKKYLGEIEAINFLINYLSNLNSNSSQKVEEKKEVKVDEAQISVKLAADAQWKKEKGLEVIKPKKGKQDEEPEKRHKKKHKKKAESKEEDKFTIPFAIQSMFQNVKISVPTSAEQIGQKIRELQERELLFERVAREQGTEEERFLAQEIRGKSQKVKPSSIQKEQKQKEEEFPSI